jgi:hypothetical protein
MVGSLNPKRQIRQQLLAGDAQVHHCSEDGQTRLAARVVAHPQDGWSLAWQL